jgi:hypothetical protein
MGGGLMQLVAYGAQDVYLTGNPQITFFKVVYRRHTNFAMESIEQTFNGQGDFGRKVQCPIVRNGDLITKMYLRVAVSGGVTTANAGASAEWAWVTSLGHSLIDNVELEIGGTRIDKHWGEWLTIWNELSRKIGQDRGFATMIGNVPQLTELSQQHPAYTLWVPMKFFFCKFDGLALPLIALQYHEVRVNFEFRPVEQLLVVKGNTSAKALASALQLRMSDCSLYVDYIYLDSEERKRFAQASHEYLIEALQFPGEESITGANSRFRLNLNHPCKFLVWASKLGRYTNGASFLAYNPSDLEATRLEATKRFVLKYGTVTGGAVTTDAYGVVTAPTGSSANLTAVFTTINAVTIANSGTSGAADVDNITILGELLPADFVSYAIDSSGAGLPTTFTFDNGVNIPTFSYPTIATTGDGAAVFDVQLYQWDNFGLQQDASENMTQTALLQLNGQDRFSQREGQYFNYVQPWQHFSNTPADGVNVYSFALNPEEHQPSGTCNFSRIDNATLALTFGRVNQGSGVLEPNFQSNYLQDNSTFSVYAVNYNVLRVMSGMAGLAYSN